MGSRHVAVAALAVALLAGPDYTAGAETVTVPPCGSTPGTTAGAYGGLVTVTVSGSLVITPGNPDQDAFYNAMRAVPLPPSARTVTPSATTGSARGRASAASSARQRATVYPTSSSGPTRLTTLRTPTPSKLTS